MDNGPLGSRFPASYTWPVGLGHIHFDIAHLVRGTVILFPLMKVDQNLNHYILDGKYSYTVKFNL